MAAARPVRSSSASLPPWPLQLRQHKKRLGYVALGHSSHQPQIPPMDFVTQCNWWRLLPLIMKASRGHVRGGKASCGMEHEEYTRRPLHRRGINAYPATIPLNQIHGWRVDALAAVTEPGGPKHGHRDGTETGPSGRGGVNKAGRGL